MDNKQTLQTNNTTISSNNSDLTNILNAINNLPETGSGEITLQEKTIAPSTANQEIVADSDYDGLSKVTISAVTSSIDSNIKATNIRKGINILGVDGALEEGITPAGTLEITTNGIHDVTNYASANVNVSSGGSTEIEDGILDKTLSGDYYNDRITFLGYGALYGCENLKTLKLPSVTRVEQYAIQGCSALETIEIPNTTYLGTYTCRNCTSLTSVDFSSVTSTGTNIFTGCSNLISVEFPVLIRVGNQTFLNCTSLTKVILRKSNTITTLSNVNAFQNTPIESGTGYIYVPDNLIDSYKAATNWSTYAAQIKPLSELPS